MSDNRRIICGEHGNDTRSGAGLTLPQLFFSQAAKFGSATFMRQKRYGIWVDVSWQEAADRVKAIAHALRRRGIGAGDVVVMISENIPELYIIEYAAQCLGASACVLYPDSSSAELRYILEHSRARVLFAQDQEQVDKALEIGASVGKVEIIIYQEQRGLWSYKDSRLVSLDTMRQDGNSAEEVRSLQQTIDRVGDLEIAALCYTSGTTGRPKGVALTHRYLMDNAYRLMSSLAIPSHIRYLSYISPAWGIEQIIGLTIGVLAPMIVHFSEKPSTVQADLREIGVEFLLFTPRQWEMLESARATKMLDAGRLRRWLVDWALKVGLRARGHGGRKGAGAQLLLAEHLVLRALRDNMGVKSLLVALSGGSGMAPEIFRRFHAMGVPLRNLYGYTEYGMITVHYGETLDPLTLGKLLQIDPAIAKPLEATLDEDGQLLLRGGSGACEYYQDPQSTAASLRNGWHLSGDVMQVDARGEFVYLDRVSHLRRLASGRLYSPQYIETQLRASPFIRDVIAIGDEKRQFVAVLVNIDETVVGPYAERKGLTWRTFADLSQHPEVHAVVRETLKAINAALEPHAQVVRFATFPKQLDPDDEELTRSRKLRREVIEERYAGLIDAIYANSDTCQVDVSVRYKDGTVGRVRQMLQIAGTN